MQWLYKKQVVVLYVLMLYQFFVNVRDQKGHLNAILVFKIEITQQITNKLIIKLLQSMCGWALAGAYYDCPILKPLLLRVRNGQSCTINWVN